MFSPGRAGERLHDRGSFEPEVEEARPGNLSVLAPLADVQFRHDVGGQLAWIQLALPGECHERVGLVIAEFRIRARAHQDGAHGGIGQDRGDGGLQTLFEEVV